MIRVMQKDDYPRVAQILKEGINTPNVTFRSEVPDWASWDRDHLPEPRLVAQERGVVVGWIALSPVSKRACYRGVAELSLYVAASERGRGIGRALLQALIKEADKCGLWTLEAHIFEENQKSVLLHERCGFRTVGVRERLGADSAGQWHNVVIMERSKPIDFINR